jgi:hypothetical protein
MTPSDTTSSVRSGCGLIVGKLDQGMNDEIVTVLLMYWCVTHKGKSICVLFFYLFQDDLRCLFIAHQVNHGLRWDSRSDPRPGPRDQDLKKPWIPGTDLGPGQIPQIYSNRLKFFSVQWGIQRPDV